jgi:isoleucyl-tRNA synthetase
LDVDAYMNKYELDNAAKAVLGFIDKLNNWFIRRSRRRFRASGMDEDKTSAYNTLFDVLYKYLHIMSSFAPFVSEYIYLELSNFISGDKKSESIHLNNLPIFNEKYIDKQLLDEIVMVRKIISL